MADVSELLREPFRACRHSLLAYSRSSHSQQGTEGEGREEGTTEAGSQYSSLLPLSLALGLFLDKRPGAPSRPWCRLVEVSRQRSHSPRPLEGYPLQGPVPKTPRA